MTPEQALAFVREHGVVLEAARGSVPSLVERIVGAPVKGSWWSHPKGHEIYAILSAVRASEDVLVCKLVDGKVTFLHRRLWPALARLAHRFAPERIEQIESVHTPSGKHVLERVPFPDWVPAEELRLAKALSEEDAARELRIE